MGKMPPGYAYQLTLPCCINCDHCAASETTCYCEKHDVIVDEVGVCPDFS